MAHLTESRLGLDHRATEQKDGRVLVEAAVSDTTQLRWLLAGFGSLVDVLGPEGLREELRRMREGWQVCTDRSRAIQAGM